MSYPALKWAWSIEGLSTSEKLVLVNLAFRSGSDGKCWPAVETICAETGLSRRGVQMALAGFKESGLVDRRDRKMQSSVFRLMVPDLDSYDVENSPGDVREQEITGAELPLGECRELRPRAQNTTCEPADRAQNNDQGAQNEGGVGAPHAPRMYTREYTLENHTQELNIDSVRTQKSAKASSKETDREFDAFWVCYPRKDAKIPARKAFGKARRSATFEQIMVGMRRFNWPTDPQYIPMPASWLNAGRWADKGAQVPNQDLERPRPPGVYKSSISL